MTVGIRHVAVVVAGLAFGTGCGTIEQSPSPIRVTESRVLGAWIGTSDETDAVFKLLLEPQARGHLYSLRMGYTNAPFHDAASWQLTSYGVSCQFTGTCMVGGPARLDCHLSGKRLYGRLSYQLRGRNEKIIFRRENVMYEALSRLHSADSSK
jgi:hypothetical protein